MRKTEEDGPRTDEQMKQEVQDTHFSAHANSFKPDLYMMISKDRCEQNLDCSKANYGPSQRMPCMPANCWVAVPSDQVR